MDPLTHPRSSGTLSPKGARVRQKHLSPRPLGGEGGERSEPGEGVPPESFSEKGVAYIDFNACANPRITGPDTTGPTSVL
ncbi:hypothetical protein SBA2_610021 [Acidobacteriia bacterium SbA2]|nr:hypothetical protein SBA2_610021 [Acidobacteriia bacterium SbA2]